VVGQLAWLAPLAWLSAVALVVGVALRGAPAASALVASLWLFELVIGEVFERARWLELTYLFATTRSPEAGFWLGNRLMLLVSAALLATGAWILLGRPDRLLGDGR
jgi:hypothetical protein